MSRHASVHESNQQRRQQAYACSYNHQPRKVEDASTSSTSESPQLKRSHEAIEINGTMTESNELQGPKSIQQAWDILMKHGIDPSSYKTAPTVPLEADESSRSHFPEFIEGNNSLDPSQGKSVARQEQTGFDLPSEVRKPTEEGPRVIETKEQRLFALFSKLVEEVGLKSTEAPDQILTALGAPESETDDDGGEGDRPSKRRRLDQLQNWSENSAAKDGPKDSFTACLPTVDEAQGLDNPVKLISQLVNTSANELVSIERDEFQKLHDTIATLQEEIQDLKQWNEPEPALPPRAVVLFRVTCGCSDAFRHPRVTTYLDPPRRFTGDRKWHLQGHYNAPDEPVFLDQNKDVVLLIYEEYECRVDATRFQWRGNLDPSKNTLGRADKGPSPVTESMVIVSPTLKEAFGWVGDPAARGQAQPLNAPYHYLYHHRSSMRDKMTRMDEEHQIHLEILISHVEKSFEASYLAANELFSRGLVSYETLHYLFEPLQVIVSQDSGSSGEFIAYEAKSWLEDVEISEDRQPGEIGQIRCWSWIFDGSFRKAPCKFKLKWPGSRKEVKEIRSLLVYPIKYAREGLEEELRSRGEKFFRCRNRTYLLYEEEIAFGDPIKRGERYMVDIPMFKQLSPNVFPTLPDEGVLELASIMEGAPSSRFLLLLPPKVWGFNMQLKKWLPLKVAHTSPVVWNTAAFDSLVVDDDTKELVKALVTNQLAAEKATDMMDGKGNGLVILLHGGPGTGKTLTAESVAELARKPLYRVTCGDIGTNVEAIDKHLQRVLHLGRHWGCVVLLDEADVFLEERSLADLQRNALVSVFLKVLEYYDGILMLTSNRVGTFDEAFKSRIQLSLHYENLTKSQRRAIWSNFIGRLEEIERDKVDTHNVRNHLDELASHDMNGRQIRNALTTARQLALYKERKMDYGLLKHAISVAGKFDEYLKNVKHNFSDDELAREGGVR